MAKGLTQDELLALTDLEIRNAVGYSGGKMSEMRRKAEYYYLGLPKGDLAPPEVEGRSSVVDTYVRNTIEAMLPQLMVRFTGSDTVVEFEPTKPGDEQKAKQCTDYLNYLFWKQNRGHMIAETWMRDALLQKNGILKVWWDTRTEETKEEYKALTEVELAQLMDDEEIEVTAKTSYTDEEDAEQRKEAMAHLGPQMQQAMQAAQQGNKQAAAAAAQIAMQIKAINDKPPVMLYDVTAVRSKKGGKLSLENVPPEEFLISRKAKDIRTSPFCAHRVARTISDLKSMGYKNIDTVSGDADGTNMNLERIERLSFDDELAYLNVDTPSGDESQRMVWVVECYIRCDWDGDGISELRKVTRCGNTVLDNEEVDLAPFVDICCIRQPHKFAGLSIADLGMETQKIKTGLLRSVIDNQHLQVNGRYFAVEDQVNLDDLLTSRPGGVVRIKNPGAVGRLDQAASDMQGTMGLLEYVEGFGESATGWTRYSQGNSAGKLGQSTATGMDIIANKDDMRVDLIARNFAEGFVELFRQMLKLVCQHQDKERQIRLNGQWVDMDPREWKNQFDVSINVGLGVGSKQQQLQQLMAIIMQQEKVHAIGAASPENIYQSSVELTKLAGFKSPDRFFSDPAKAPPQPPKPDPLMVKGQIDVQVEQAKGQVAAQLKQLDVQATQQIEALKAKYKQETDLAAQQFQQAQAEAQMQMQARLKELEASMQDARERDRMSQEAALEQLRIQNEQWAKQLDSNTRIAVAEIQANAAGQAATVDAQAQVASAQAASAKVMGGDTKADGMAQAIATLSLMVEKLSQPKQVIRGPDGRIVGVQ
jgi:hypothetical protein